MTEPGTPFERIDPDLPEWEWERAWHLQRYEFAARQISAETCFRVLDVACGIGLGTHCLATCGEFSIVGVDRDAAAIDTAERRFAHPSIRYVQDDCETLSKAKSMAPFDAVVSIETIEHLHHPDRFLANIRDSLADRGLLIMSTPNASVTSPDGIVHFPFHVREFTASQLTALLLEAGFAVECLFGQQYSRKGNLMEAFRRSIHSLRESRLWNAGRWLKNRFFAHRKILIPTQEEYEILPFTSVEHCEELGADGPLVLIVAARRVDL